MNKSIGTGRTTKGQPDSVILNGPTDATRLGVTTIGTFTKKPGDVTRIPAGTVWH